MRPHKASGKMRVRVNGKDILLGPIGSEEAERNYRDLLKQLAAAPPPVPERRSGLMVAEVVERFLLHAQKRYSQEGREASQFGLAVGPLLAECASLPAADVGARHLHRVRERMVALGWSRGVIARQTGRLRSVWRWAEMEDLVPEGRWSALRALPPLGAADRRVKDSEPRQAASWEVLARVCRQSPPACRAMLLVGWWSGARPGELRRMVPVEIDRSADVWLFRPTKHKCAWRGHARVIALGPRCQRVLTPWLEGRGAEEWVFPSGPGRCYTMGSLSNAVGAAAERAGAKGFCAYQARHSARRNVTRAAGLDEARAILGHRTLEQTAEYASGQDLETAMEVARKMG